MWPLVFILQFPQIYYVVCCQDIVLLFFFVVLFTRLPLTVGSAPVLLIKSPFDTYIFLHYSRYFVLLTCKHTAETCCCMSLLFFLSSDDNPFLLKTWYFKDIIFKILFASRYSLTITLSFVIPGYVLFATDLVLAVSVLRSPPILWHGWSACDWSPLLFP